MDSCRPSEKFQDILASFYLPFVGGASISKETLFVKKGIAGKWHVIIADYETISSRDVIDDNLRETQDMTESACNTILKGDFKAKSCNPKNAKIVTES